MSENRNRDYSEYDAMTTEELEEILRLDASAPEGEDSDTELLLYVMGVLANRRKNNITGKTALEAWESFQQNYLADEEECPDDMQEPISIRTAAPWLRRLIAAAAVIALVVCIPVTAKAIGWEDIWNIFARWAKETFSFVSSENSDVTEPATEDDLAYSSLQDLLERNNRSFDMVPTWIPDGFILKKVEKAVTPIQEIYIAHYGNGDKDLSIRVQNYISTEFQKIEIEEEIDEVYVSSEVEYYIFENVDQIQVIWVKDSYECNISGDLSIDEAKKMIDSIEKG